MTRRPALHHERGNTLIELAIGMASLALLGGVVVGIFSAGVKSFTSTVRITSVLTNARQAMEGGSSLPGMSWQIRDALSVSTLDTAQLALTSSDAVPVQYSVSNAALLNTTQGVQKQQAQKIDTLQTQYYNINSSGQIIQSTSAATATFATAWVQMKGSGKNAKTYTFFSGARLRNHQ